jgi:hypothetical protein
MDSSDQVFWLTVMGSVVAVLGLVIKALSKSKCDIIECGSCLKIHRNVELEEKIDELELAHHRDNDSIK